MKSEQVKHCRPPDVSIERQPVVFQLDENRDMDRIVRVGFYKTKQEFFTLHKNSLKVQNHVLPKDELPQNISLVRFGSATRKSEFHDVRASAKSIEDIIKSSTYRPIRQHLGSLMAV